ncbi:NUDIX domain-containing protein [Streptomyces chartreusis]|uniref:NUDIX domain-containing protein n=1 Tax=Streptomyces chartreusis TaxID=1969 RepID=UPI00382D56B9
MTSQWPYRTAATVCRDPGGRLLVHRRSQSLSRFPGCYEVFAGGAVLPQETYRAAAVRELREELGAGGPLRHLFKCLLPGAVSPYWIAIYEVCLTTEPRPNPAEVEWCEWMPEGALAQAMNRWHFTADGRIVWQYYLSHRPSAP